MKRIIAILLIFILSGCAIAEDINLGGVKEGQNAYVEILYNGEVVEYFLLTDDLELEIEFVKGAAVEYLYPADIDKDGNEIERTETFRGYNRIIIKDGLVDMVEADCPDQDCVHMRPIGRDSVNPNIQCAPNRVEVRIVGVDVEIDGVV